VSTEVNRSKGREVLETREVREMREVREVGEVREVKILVIHLGSQESTGLFF
jgi:hypothetical protein